MKRLLAALTMIIFLLNTSPVSAHFLATDKNIGAVLHIDPSDDPVIGQQTSFFFEFKDKDNKFDPKNCDCIFLILENGNTIYTQPLYQNNSNPTLSNGSAFYTFRNKGAYEINVTGRSTKRDAFKSFNFKWSLRVEKTAALKNSTNNFSSFFSIHFAHLVIIGMGVSVFFYLIRNNAKKKKVTK
jgi:hypothetical protein